MVTDAVLTTIKTEQVDKRPKYLRMPIAHCSTGKCGTVYRVLDITARACDEDLVTESTAQWHTSSES